MVGDGLRAQLFGFDIQHRVDGVLLLYPEIIEFIGIPDEHGMEAFLSGEGVVHLVEPMILNGRIDDGIVARSGMKLRIRWSPNRIERLNSA